MDLLNGQVGPKSIIYFSSQSFFKLAGLFWIKVWKNANFSSISNVKPEKEHQITVTELLI